MEGGKATTEKKLAEKLVVWLGKWDWRHGRERRDVREARVVLQGQWQQQYVEESEGFFSITSTNLELGDSQREELPVSKPTLSQCQGQVVDNSLCVCFLSQTFCLQLKKKHKGLNDFAQLCNTYMFSP